MELLQTIFFKFAQQNKRFRNHVFILSNKVDIVL